MKLNELFTFKGFPIFKNIKLGFLIKEKEDITTHYTVSSRMIKYLEYLDPSQTLIITFNSGKKYKYLFVQPKVVQDFLIAESKGKFFNKNIRDKYITIKL